MLFLIVVVNIICLGRIIIDIHNTKKICILYDEIIKNLKNSEIEKLNEVERKSFSLYKIEFYIMSFFFINVLVLKDDFIFIIVSIITLFGMILLTIKRICNFKRSKKIDYEKVKEEFILYKTKLLLMK